MNAKHNPGRARIEATEAWIFELAVRQGVTLNQLYKIVPEVAARMPADKRPFAFNEQYDPPGFAERYSDRLARSGVDAG